MLMHLQRHHAVSECGISPCFTALVVAQYH